MRKNPPEPPSRFLLDQFSGEDIVTWKKREEELEAYNLRLFYHLEGLRQLHHKALCEALNKADVLKIKGETWSRIVDAKYSNNPLSPVGSIKIGGRFNIGQDIDPGKFPAFPVLYLGQSHDTAFKEKFGTPKAANGLASHELALRKPSSYFYVNATVSVDAVFDLNRAANLKAFCEILSTFKVPDDLQFLARKLGLGKQRLIKKTYELRTNLLDPFWNRTPVQFDTPANSQLFGRFLRDAGFKAIMYPSARAQGQSCLAIFVENLADTESYIELADPVADTVAFKKLSADNLKQILNC